jgi:parvulin-like peptidyl-prolyl isomerase
VHPPTRLAIAAALSVTLLAGCGGFLATAAATVDGRKVDEDLFQRELEFLLSDPRFAEQQLPGEQGEEQREQYARDFLTFLIHQEVVQSYAAANGIEAPDDQVDALLDQQIAALGGRERFQQMLRGADLTESQVRALFEQQVLREKVADSVTAEEASEEALMQTYRERELEFTQLDLAHILVADRREAERLARQATPDNFARLARQFSQDPSSAVNGGDLGIQQAAGLFEPFAREALDTPVGEIGGPVQTESGWHLIWVKDRQTQAFEEVRPQLLEEARGEVFSNWLLQRVREAEIRVNPRYGAFDDQSGQVIPRTSTSPEPPPVQLEP